MDKLKDIAKYGKLLHEKDLVIGQGGNISVKDGDNIIIKKRCADMSLGYADNFIKVPIKDAENPSEELSSESPFHVACYKARQDIGAVIHVHSPATIAVSSKVKTLKSVSYEFDCIIKKDVPVIEYVKPGSQDLADAIAGEIKKGSNAVLMKKHGAVIVGRDLEETYLRTLALERASITYIYSL